MKYRIMTGVIGLIAASLLAWAESTRPHLVERCSPHELGHQEALAQRWKFLEGGPGRDLCFHFRGKPHDFRLASDVSAVACVKFVPVAGNDPRKYMDVAIDYFEWSNEGE
jgi:hypothetical protein